MKNNIEQYLPIGSIVKVKDNNFVIVGYRVSLPKITKKYDYMGYPYPYGFLSNEENFVFDTSEIKAIIFEGYKDEQYHEMIKNINNNTQKEE